MQPVFDTKEEEEHFYRKQKEDERLKPCSKVRTDNKNVLGLPTLQTSQSLLLMALSGLS